MKLGIFGILHKLTEVAIHLISLSIRQIRYSPVNLQSGYVFLSLYSFLPISPTPLYVTLALSKLEYPLLGQNLEKKCAVV